jgi:hypothetical protein
MATIFIKPAPGLKVRDPVTHRHIPAEGCEVSATDTYWARRIRSRDVVVIDPPTVVTVGQIPDSTPAVKE